MDFARPLCALALLGLAQLASAQAYKCTADGKTTYQDKPCATGGGTKMDLPGAFSPPPLAGGSLGGYSAQDLALGLAFDKAMVQRCPLAGSSSVRLDALATALSPLLKSVSKAQLDEIDLKASKRANDMLTSPNRATACKLIDGSIETAFQQLSQAMKSPRGGGAKPSL